MSSSNSEAASDATERFTLSNLSVPSITSKKLTGSATYKSWAASVKIWFAGQGKSEHLSTKFEDVPKNQSTKWKQTDSQLLSILLLSIDPSIVDLFQPFETCYECGKKLLIVMQMTFSGFIPLFLI